MKKEALWYKNTCLLTVVSLVLAELMYLFLPGIVIVGILPIAILLAGVFASGYIKKHTKPVSTFIYVYFFSFTGLMILSFFRAGIDYGSDIIILVTILSLLISHAYFLLYSIKNALRGDILLSCLMIGYSLLVLVFNMPFFSPFLLFSLNVFYLVSIVLIVYTLALLVYLIKDTKLWGYYVAS